MYQLTCRERERGRGLVPVAAAGGSPDPAKVGPDCWTIFIHGYNNSEEAAAKTWLKTAKELSRRQVDLEAVVLFYWPGDYSRSEVLSAMNYPRTVPIAEQAARLLAAYLQRATQDRRVQLQLSFVAHSLGSLVVLETVRLLRLARANVVIRDILLMAAAVPEGFCVLDQEPYGKPFSFETKELVLYSLDDRVLKRYFQVGQEIAGRFTETQRRAVGRSGGPGAGLGERWTASTHLDGFDHGYYWKKPASVARIARVVESNRGISGQSLEFDQRRDFLHEDVLSMDVLNEDDYLPFDVIARWLMRPVYS